MGSRRKKRKTIRVKVRKHRRKGKTVKRHNRKIKKRFRAFQPRTEGGIQTKRFLDELEDQENIPRSEIFEFSNDAFTDGKADSVSFFDDVKKNDEEEED